MHRRGGTVLLCGDDPSLAALAHDLPNAALYTITHLATADGQRQLEVDGTRYVVTREVVGDSNLYGLEVAVRVARLLGLSDAATRRFLAPPL